MNLESSYEKSELSVISAEKKTISEEIEVIESKLVNINKDIDSRLAMKEKVVSEIHEVTNKELSIILKSRIITRYTDFYLTMSFSLTFSFFFYS